jgi:D-sedoheptulose 7-phosphate isomerase
MMIDFYKAYVQRIDKVLNKFSWESVHQLSLSLQQVWRKGNKVLLCGNGGSAGNAIHLANDFNYGIDKNGGIGLSVEALTAIAYVISQTG